MHPTTQTQDIMQNNEMKKVKKKKIKLGKGGIRKVRVEVLVLTNGGDIGVQNGFVLRWRRPLTLSVSTML